MVSSEHYTKVHGEIIEVLGVEFECSGCVYHLVTGHDIVLWYLIFARPEKDSSPVAFYAQDLSPVLREEVIAELTAVILKRYGRGGS